MSPSKCSISFSSFRNNNATDYSCILCAEVTVYMHYTDIIENQHGPCSTTRGIITGNQANISMTYCNIYENIPIGKSAKIFIAVGLIQSQE